MKVLLIFIFLATVYALPYSKFQPIHSSGPNANVKLSKQIQDSQFDQVKNGVSPVSFLTEVNDSDESNEAEDYGSGEEITLENLIKFIQKIINEKLSNANSADESNIPSNGVQVQNTNPSAITLEKDTVESHENSEFTSEYESENESDSGSVSAIGSIKPKSPKHPEPTETPKYNMPTESEATEAYEGSGFSQDAISGPKEGNKAPKAEDSIPENSKVTEAYEGSGFSQDILSEPKEALGSNISEGMNTSGEVTAPQGLTASDGITASGGVTAPQGLTESNGITASEGTAISEVVATLAGITASQGIKGEVTAINGITTLKGITVPEEIMGSEETEISAGTEASEITKELDGSEISVESKAFQEIKASDGQKSSATTYSSKNSNTGDVNLLSGQINYLNLANTPPKFYYKAAQGHLQHNLVVHPFAHHH